MWHIRFVLLSVNVCLSSANVCLSDGSDYVSPVIVCLSDGFDNLSSGKYHSSSIKYCLSSIKYHLSVGKYYSPSCKYDLSSFKYRSSLGAIAGAVAHLCLRAFVAKPFKQKKLRSNMYSGVLKYKKRFFFIIQQLRSWQQPFWCSWHVSISRCLLPI